MTVQVINSATLGKYICIITQIVLQGWCKGHRTVSGGGIDNDGGGIIVIYSASLGFILKVRFSRFVHYITTE